MLKNRLIFILGLLGLVISGYLAYEYSLPTSISCPIAGSGCDIVRNSPYSVFLGIQLPYWGLAFYLSIILSSILLSTTVKLNLILARFFLAAFGVLFSLYLTYLEAVVIKAYCFWCVLSAILTMGIFSLSFLEMRSQINEKRN